MILSLLVNGLLVLLKLLHFGFEVVHMDFHFVLQTDVASDVGFQLLDHLFVLARRLSVFVGILFVALHHVEQSLLHGLLNEVLRLDRYSAQRRLHDPACSRAVSLALVVVLLQIVDFQVHDYLDAGSDVLQDLEAVYLSQQLVLLVIQVVIVDFVQLVSGPDLDGQVQVDDSFFDVSNVLGLFVQLNEGLGYPVRKLLVQQALVDGAHVGREVFAVSDVQVQIVQVPLLLLLFPEFLHPLHVLQFLLQLLLGGLVC